MRSRSLLCCEDAEVLKTRARETGTRIQTRSDVESNDYRRSGSVSRADHDEAATNGSAKGLLY
jgi:hypothetical protein